MTGVLTQRRGRNTQGEENDVRCDRGDRDLSDTSTNQGMLPPELEKARKDSLPPVSEGAWP